MKKFSKEWFNKKIEESKRSYNSSDYRLNYTKGYKPCSPNQDKRKQRVESYFNLAKSMGVKL